MKYNAVTIIEKSVNVEIEEIKVNLPMQWADGMIGVMPIFEDKESADKYANKMKEANVAIADNIGVIEFDTLLFKDNVEKAVNVEEGKQAIREILDEVSEEI